MRKFGDAVKAGHVSAARREIVGHIADNVSDEELRATFQNSAPVREVLEEAESA